VLDEQAVILGGTVEVAEYGASASDELAERCVAALGDRAAVLLRNHGAVGVGRTLDEALAAVELTERVAQVQLLAALIGGARELPDDVVARERTIYLMLHGLG
jgi:L-fuculose-phosphate aldolase